MQFRPTSASQVTGLRPALRRSWSDRECPLHTAHDRCLWHVGGTAGKNDDARNGRRRLPARGRVRPVLGDHCLVAMSPEGLRQPDAETRTLARLLKGSPVAAVWWPDLWFLGTRRDRP
jgi:hypothetical protein